MHIIPAFNYIFGIFDNYLGLFDDQFLDISSFHKFFHHFYTNILDFDSIQI